MRAPIALAFSSVVAVHMGWAELHVGPGRAHQTLKSAIAAAAAGDTIVVHGGHFAEGNIQIGKSLTLVGVDEPVIDGEFKDELVTVTASNVTIRGFTLTHGGRSSTRELAGIRVERARNVVLAENRLRDCNYGIYLADSRQCEVRGNVIEGRPDRELNSGNGIHAWNCEGTRVIANKVSGHRDGVYLEFASQSAVEDNLVADNLRYGLHFMTAHSSRYQRNRFSRNGAGVAVMYSRNVLMADNLFEASWGGSAYGLLLKDLTDSAISGNHFVRNSTGVYAQGATRTTFERNLFKENGWALRILSNGEDNRFLGNNFSRNSFDVGTNGQLDDHLFAGNYWDRYEGYDLKRDGVGDVPFRPVNLYAIVVERVPTSLFLLHSFMVHLLDRAEKAFPTLTPDSVVDASPSIRPNPL